MSYTEPLSNQIYRFILAVGFGIILGIIYEVIVLLRTIISRKKAAVITQDIIFSIIASILSFFFMLVYNEGVVRLNLIFAEGVGLYAFHLAFGCRFTLPIKRFAAKFKLKWRKKRKTE